MNGITSGGTGQPFYLSMEPEFTVVHCLPVSCHLHTEPKIESRCLTSGLQRNPIQVHENLFHEDIKLKTHASKRASRKKLNKSTRWKQSPHSCRPHSWEFERGKWNSTLTWRLKSIPFRSESWKRKKHELKSKSASEIRKFKKNIQICHSLMLQISVKIVLFICWSPLYCSERNLNKCIFISNYNQNKNLSKIN